MEKTKLIKEIIELQRKVDRSRRQPTLDVWMSLPITIAQLKSLFFISNQRSSNLGKLAAALGVTPANVTGIVDRLLEQGLVSRNENAQDRRMLLLGTTEKGEELVANLRERRWGYMSKILARLNEDELATLAQGLTSLVNAIEIQEGKTKDEHD
jgi:MarR family transcriptional regulator, organic hydroperoxide resistance regulator